MDAFKLYSELIKATTSDQVIEILKNYKLWEDKKSWRYYGDNDSNAGTTGTQQSEPVKAFVEKVTNSIDAVLLLNCIKNGIDPTDWERTPRTVKEAVEQFCPHAERRKDIYVYAEGNKKPGYPTICIYDDGEGQKPENVPDTILSLGKSNKNKIQFLQGQYNMGGTGALRFCGDNHLQFVLTKRNSDLIKKGEENPWSFTIVRCELPEGNERNQFYSYLAPVNSDKNFRKGSLLTFNKDELPLVPKQNKSYQIKKRSGTLIKCFDYQIKNKSNILFQGELMNNVELMMPDCEMPVRFAECRDYKGKDIGSFENSMVGLIKRLKNQGDKVYKDTLEEGFPVQRQLQFGDNNIPISIYAFKRNKKKKTESNAETRRLNREGIIITLNGQHYYDIPYNFFSRKTVKLPNIAKDIIAIANFSKISNALRTKLFMANKENMAKNKNYNELIKQFEDIFRKCEPLKELQNKRKSQDARNIIEDDKTFDEILNQIININPALAELFGVGNRLSSAFNMQQADDKKVDEKLLVEYPTFFKFKQIDYGEILKKTATEENTIRLSFETDAVDEYFTREERPGLLKVFFKNEKLSNQEAITSTSLKNGIFGLNISYPDNVNIGDEINIDIQVNDDTQENPFLNRAIIKIIQKEIRDTPPSPPKPNPKPKPPKPGEKKEVPGGLNIPHPQPVSKDKWDDFDPPMDEYDALCIEYQESDDSKVDNYKYYVNMDNFYLLNELKRTKVDIEVIKYRFQFSMVLFAVSLIAQLKTEKKDDDITEVTERVRFASKSISRVVLPIIHALGSLDELPKTEADE